MSLSLLHDLAVLILSGLLLSLFIITVPLRNTYSKSSNTKVVFRFILLATVILQVCLVLGLFQFLGLEHQGRLDAETPMQLVTVPPVFYMLCTICLISLPLVLENLHHRFVQAAVLMSLLMSGFVFSVLHGFQSYQAISLNVSTALHVVIAIGYEISCIFAVLFSMSALIIDSLLRKGGLSFKGLPSLETSERGLKYSLVFIVCFAVLLGLTGVFVGSFKIDQFFKYALLLINFFIALWGLYLILSHSSSLSSISKKVGVALSISICIQLMQRMEVL